MTRYTLDTSDTHKYGEILLVSESREDYITVGPKDGDEDQPNYEMAHLIAAAPELYEALNELAAILNGDGRTYVQEALERAQAYLAKARGEKA